VFVSKEKKCKNAQTTISAFFSHWIPILPEDFPLKPAGDGGGSGTRRHFISGSRKLYMKKCLIDISNSSVFLFLKNFFV
jgi:hypothetical protein